MQVMSDGLTRSRCFSLLSNTPRRPPNSWRYRYSSE